MTWLANERAVGRSLSLREGACSCTIFSFVSSVYDAIAFLKREMIGAAKVQLELARESLERMRGCVKEETIDFAKYVLEKAREYVEKGEPELATGELGILLSSTWRVECR